MEENPSTAWKTRSPTSPRRPPSFLTFQLFNGLLRFSFLLTLSRTSSFNRWFLDEHAHSRGLQASDSYAVCPRTSKYRCDHSPALLSQFRTSSCSCSLPYNTLYSSPKVLFIAITGSLDPSGSFSTRAPSVNRLSPVSWRYLLQRNRFGYAILPYLT